MAVIVHYRIMLMRLKLQKLDYRMWVMERAEPYPQGRWKVLSTTPTAIKLALVI